MAGLAAPAMPPSAWLPDGPAGRLAKRAAPAGRTAGPGLTAKP
jgi:hypothetical protein